ncbi:MAG: hypothetical protein RLZZ172_451 [Bacteroidota bacterium]|jgi:hypothetical protein
MKSFVCKAKTSLIPETLHIQSNIYKIIAKQGIVMSA